MHNHNTFLHKTVKNNAQLLHQVLKQDDSKIKLSSAQEKLAHLYNFNNFNHLIGTLKQEKFFWPKRINVFENPFGIREIIDVQDQIFSASSKTAIFAVNNYTDDDFDDDDDFRYEGIFVQNPEEMLKVCLDNDIASIIIEDFYGFIRRKHGKDIFEILAYSLMPITVVVTKLSFISDFVNIDLSHSSHHTIDLHHGVIQHSFISNIQSRKIAAMVFHGAVDSETRKYKLCLIEENVPGYLPSEELLSIDYEESQKLVEQFNKQTFDLTYKDALKIFFSTMT